MIFEESVSVNERSKKLQELVGQNAKESSLLEDALRQVAAEREREVELLRADIQRFHVDQGNQRDELVRLREDNERLREDIETEKVWREQAQRAAHADPRWLQQLRNTLS